jgi:hypothetical protein
MKRESVKIWAGWLESIDNIPARESRTELALAIFEYALDEREYTGADPWVKVLLPTIKKSIDNSTRNAINGQKGGLQKAANSTATSDATTAANSTANNTKTIDKDNRQYTIDKDNKEKNIKEKTEQSSSVKFIFKKALIERGCSDQIASDYMAIRNKRRAPSTITAFERIEKEAEKYISARPGATFEDVVRLMIEHNWLSFEAAWVKDTSSSDSEESEYVKAMNAQIRRQREIDAELEAERQRRKEAANNNNK